MSGTSARRNRQIQEAVLRGINPAGDPAALAERLKLVPPQERAAIAERDICDFTAGMMLATLLKLGTRLSPQAVDIFKQGVRTGVRAGLGMGAVDPVWARRVLIGAARHRAEAPMVLATFMAFQRQLIADHRLPELFDEAFPELPQTAPAGEPAA